MAEVIEYLPVKYEILSSSPILPKQQKTELLHAYACNPSTRKAEVGEY
jgi:hypothetical protein